MADAADPAAFTPFPNPVRADDTPLVTAAGLSYRCTGCGATGLPGGMWIHETVADGVVVGLRMTAGEPAAGEPPTVLHECGKPA